MIAYLRDRPAVLMIARVDPPRGGVEKALVCLYGGVFFRSQYLAFIGRTNWRHWPTASSGAPRG